ncbi:MAG: hypothetical protein ABRQ26_05685 [Syntrophomonadaceae bacterium]
MSVLRVWFADKSAMSALRIGGYIGIRIYLKTILRIKNIRKVVSVVKKCIVRLFILLFLIYIASSFITIYVYNIKYLFGTDIINTREYIEREFRGPLAKVPQGWSKSTLDPNCLIAYFPELKSKPDYKLVSYQFMEGSNGNGFVWAVPDDAVFPEPDHCETVDGISFLRFLKVPKPPGALDNVMACIEGDGSPSSYLSASLFGREVKEFGAAWHGLRWDTHTILFSAVFKVWKYAAVIMVTYSGLSPEGLYCYVDTYKGSYVFNTGEIVLWQGTGGYNF